MSLEMQIGAAVEKFARKNGLVSGRRISAHRVSGTPGLSGIWQCYQSIRDGGQTSVGPNLWAGDPSDIRVR